MSKLHFQVPSSIFISPWSTSLHDIAVCDIAVCDNAISQVDPYQSRMEKKLHFLDLHSLLYLPFQLSRLEDSFLCLSPLSFLNHSKSKHFRLIPTIFFVVVGNSFAQLYSSSSFMLYILWIFKDIFKKTFSWICCFGRRGIFFLSVGTIGFWVQHIVLIDTNKIYW